MPRPVRVALAVGVLALPAPLLHAALASAAGSLFEALPFVLAAALLPGGRWRALAPLALCGCGGALPAALALPALALCWINFGPGPTLARAAAALGSLAFARRRHTAAPLPVDPLRELGRLGLAAFAAALALGALRGLAAAAGQITWLGSATGVALEFVFGGMAGALAPCGTAGIVAAAALRAACPAAAAGLLATSGLVRLRLGRPQRKARCAPGWPAFLGLALAALWLGLEGGRGFLNPRLWLLAPLGAGLAGVAGLTAARNASARTTAGTWLPAALLAALVAGSPPPGNETATLPLGLYPGQRVVFTGRLERDRRAVSRPAILCCRADAHMLRLGLDRPLRFAPGTWVEVAGAAERSGSSLDLRVESVRPIAPPQDPFTYL